MKTCSEQPRGRRRPEVQFGCIRAVAPCANRSFAHSDTSPCTSSAQRLRRDKTTTVFGLKATAQLHQHSRGFQGPRPSGARDSARRAAHSPATSGQRSTTVRDSAVQHSSSLHPLAALRRDVLHVSWAPHGATQISGHEASLEHKANKTTAKSLLPPTARSTEMTSYHSQRL